MAKTPEFNSSDFQPPMVDMSVLETAIHAGPETNQIPARPSVTRLLQNKPTDVELVTDFRNRLLANFLELAAIKDEMKREGGFDFNFGWSMDAFGRFTPGPITIFKVIP